jgi:hypothetical protein
MTDKLIIRSALTENYTVIPNALLNDTTISGECLAMMVYLLSKPSDWQLSVKNLMKRFGWGRDKTYQAIAGLIERGYVIKNAHRNGGKFNSYTYFVYDTPQISPLPEKPDTEKPDTVNQYITKERDYSGSVLQSTDSHKSDEWFDKFWSVVAHKEERKTSKAKFLRACKTTDPQAIINAYEGQLAAHLASGKQSQYFKRPKTWLHGECWNDEYQSAEAVLFHNRYTNKVKGWLRTGYWHPEWGDPPDTPSASPDARDALKELTDGKKTKSKGL